MAPVISRSPAGAPEANRLRAVIRYPPSTFSARPEPAIQSDPPLVTSRMCSRAIRLSSGSTEVAFWCSTATPQWRPGGECMEKASAVEPQW